MRVLVLEDEQALREQLAERLRAAGYAVDVAANGEDGEFVGLEYPIDAAVVDLGLPDKPGTAVIETWRARGKAFPVLILTARGRWEASSRIARTRVSGSFCGLRLLIARMTSSSESNPRASRVLRRAPSAARTGGAL